MKIKELMEEPKRLSEEFNSDFRELKNLDKIRLSLARRDFFSNINMWAIILVILYCFISFIVLSAPSFFWLFSHIFTGGLGFLFTMVLIHKYRIEGWKNLIRLKKDLNKNNNQTQRRR